MLHFESCTQAHIAEVLVSRGLAQGNFRKYVYMLARTRMQTHTAGVVVAGAIVVIALTVALTWWYWNKCHSKVHVFCYICVGACASVLMFVSRCDGYAFVCGVLEDDVPCNSVSVSAICPVSVLSCIDCEYLRIYLHTNTTHTQTCEHTHTRTTHTHTHAHTHTHTHR